MEKYKKKEGLIRDIYLKKEKVWVKSETERERVKEWGREKKWNPSWREIWKDKRERKYRKKGDSERREREVERNRAYKRENI